MTKFFAGFLLGLLIGFSFKLFYSPTDAEPTKKDTLTVQFKDQVMEVDTTKMDSIK